MPSPPRPPLTYADAGVSIDAGNALVRRLKPLAARTARPGTRADLGGFGALFDLKATRFADPLLVATNDGVGTKLRLAIETGQHDTIGQDLVAMCVNDLLAQGAEPLFFLDYFACGALDVDIAEKVMAGIAGACSEAGCALIGGETAEMPGLYAAQDYDLAGFAVGAVERAEVLPRGDIAADDVVIGLASTGAHSNGFSLLRRIAADRGLGWGAACPFEAGVSLGTALLRPTRIYVRAVLAALAHGRIKALAHITGGGLPENLPRVLPPGLGAELSLAAIPMPPVFVWAAQAGNVPAAEMLRTFNCGVGMVAIVAPGDADATLDSLQSEGVAGAILGQLTARSEGGVTVTGHPFAG